MSDLFIPSKYTTWYFQIVEGRKSHGLKKLDYYTEKHHIIPKSLGGPDTPENLVRLTPREHYICHWLLTKMCDDPRHRQKMFFCLNWFRKHMTSRVYGNFQEEYSKLMSEKLTGVPKSEEHRRNIRKSKLGENNPLWNGTPWNSGLGGTYKLGPRQLKRTWITDGKVNKQVHTNPDETPVIPEGWRIGRSNVKKGKSTKPPKRWITNGNESKMILKSEPIPKGWTPGRIVTN